MFLFSHQNLLTLKSWFLRIFRIERMQKYRLVYFLTIFQSRKTIKFMLNKLSRKTLLKHKWIVTLTWCIQSSKPQRGHPRVWKVQRQTPIYNMFSIFWVAFSSFIVSFSHTLRTYALSAATSIKRTIHKPLVIYIYWLVRSNTESISSTVGTYLWNWNRGEK